MKQTTIVWSMSFAFIVAAMTGLSCIDMINKQDWGWAALFALMSIANYINATRTLIVEEIKQEIRNSRRGVKFNDPIHIHN
jgi:hypothetical protein